MRSVRFRRPSAFRPSVRRRSPRSATDASLLRVSPLGRSTDLSVIRTRKQPGQERHAAAAAAAGVAVTNSSALVCILNGPPNGTRLIAPRSEANRFRHLGRPAAIFSRFPFRDLTVSVIVRRRSVAFFLVYYDLVLALVYVVHRHFNASRVRDPLCASFRSAVFSIIIDSPLISTYSPSETFPRPNPLKKKLLDCNYNGFGQFF